MSHMTSIIRKEVRELLTPGSVISVLVMVVLFAGLGGLIGGEVDSAAELPTFGFVVDEDGNYYDGWNPYDVLCNETNYGAEADSKIMLMDSAYGDDEAILAEMREKGITSVLALPDALRVLFRVILIPGQLLHHQVYFPAYPVARLRRRGQGRHVHRQTAGHGVESAAHRIDKVIRHSLDVLAAVHLAFQLLHFELHFLCAARAELQLGGPLSFFILHLIVLGHPCGQKTQVSLYRFRQRIGVFCHCMEDAFFRKLADSARCQAQNHGQFRDSHGGLVSDFFFFLFSHQTTSQK